LKEWRITGCPTALIPAFIGLGGTIIGFGLGAVFTHWREERKIKKETTEEFIKEFYSISFLRHRIPLSELRRKVLAGNPSIESIAGRITIAARNLENLTSISALNFSWAS
jgi:hypothetical protein